MELPQLIQTIAINALPVLFAITVHEAAHGYAARHFGDNTAWSMGRVTLNPLKHIDLMGTIVIPLLTYISMSFVIGYAKPVPVRFGNLRNPKRDMVWVALAGPGANLAQAWIWGVLLYVLVGAGVEETFFLEMCQAGKTWNIMLFVFNLFPLPPLDGGRILVGLLPYRQAELVSRLEPWGFFIVMALALSGIISSLWLRPMLTLTSGLLDLLLLPLSWLAH
jgi:Zn-dependent protease